MDETIDYQQTKSLFDIGWMVAILEGEGYFGLAKQLLPSHHYRYKPTIGINNTSLKLIEQIEEILKKWQIGYWKSKRNFQYKKDQFLIVIQGYKRGGKLLSIILPYLNAKKPQADILWNYIQYRKPLNNHDFCGEEEDSFYQRIKELNKKGKVSTTKH